MTQDDQPFDADPVVARMQARVRKACQPTEDETEAEYVDRMERLQHKRNLQAERDIKRRGKKPTDEPPTRLKGDLPTWDGVSKFLKPEEITAHWRYQREQRRKQMESFAWESAIFLGKLAIQERIASTKSEKLPALEQDNGPVFVFNPPVVSSADDETSSSLQATFEVDSEQKTAQIDEYDQNPVSQSSEQSADTDENLARTHSDHTAEAFDKVECHNVSQPFARKPKLTQDLLKKAERRCSKLHSGGDVFSGKMATMQDLGGGGDESRDLKVGGFQTHPTVPALNPPPTPSNPAGRRICNGPKPQGVSLKPDPETPDSVSAAAPYIARGRESASAVPERDVLQDDPDCSSSAPADGSGSSGEQVAS